VLVDAAKPRGADFGTAKRHHPVTNMSHAGGRSPQRLDQAAAARKRRATIAQVARISARRIRFSLWEYLLHMI
jgi:hypothetical protein